MSELSITCPAGADTLDGASKSGDFTLSWTGPEGARFRLIERQDDGDAITLYEGPQLGSTVTGRTEGAYSYQVGVVPGEASSSEGPPQTELVQWSEPCQVLVAPYSLPVAFAFFAFGLVVTVATVVLVVTGHRAHRRGEIG